MASVLRAAKMALMVVVAFGVLLWGMAMLFAVGWWLVR